MARVAVWFAPLEISRDFIDYPYFADLGAVQAAAVLREAGHQVTLHDALASPGASLTPLAGDQVRLGVDVETLLAGATDAELALVAYTPFQRPPTRDPALARLLEGLRAQAPTRPILLADLYQSGQHVVDASSEDILAAYPEVDGLLRYEAEGHLVPWVAELIEQGRPVTREVRDGNNGPEIDLNELPLPAWDLVDTRSYFAFHRSVMQGLGRPHWAFPIDADHLPMLSSRGCPFRCAHCSSNPGLPAGKPKTQRRYSPERLAAQLDWLQQHGARSVHLLDELANVNERHFDALTELLEARGLNFEIPNGVRADYVRPKHLAAMSGRLTTLSISAESGVQRVVDQVVGKQLDLRAIVETAERAHAAGVHLLIHYIIGMPGESAAEINGTLSFALDLFERFNAEPSVQFATPLPGTRLAREALKKGATALPVVRDWGPYFQGNPSLETSAFSSDDLRAFKQSFDRRMEALRQPAHVRLAVSYQCNNRCTFCSVGSPPALPPGNKVPTDERARLRALSEHLSEEYRRGARELTLDGGEPTLSRGVFQLIQIAKRIGFDRVSLITNGRLASYPEYAKRLADSGLDEIWVSLHGSHAALHDNLVGDPGAFEQTLSGLQQLLSCAPQSLKLGVQITLTRQNQRDLSALFALLSRLGVRNVGLLGLEPGGAGYASAAYDLEELSTDLVAALQSVKAPHEAVDSSDTLSFCVKNLPVCALPGFERLVEVDLSKLAPELSRDRYVSLEGVDLPSYVRAQRTYTERCVACHYRTICGGFVDRDTDQPSWLVPLRRLTHTPVGAAR
ncbi:MAG: radical SAM protein [Polyangiaceae bacterium]|nr:radical SAM protein [Polyangiaceae bacterium]